jgi:hypothetical protein
MSFLVGSVILISIKWDVGIQDVILFMKHLNV